SRRRHTSFSRDWSSVCSSDLLTDGRLERPRDEAQRRGRRGQLDPLEPVAQELKEPQTVAGALEELEPMHRGLGAPVPERELELPDLRMADSELTSELLDHAGHGVDEDRQARALVDELD